MSVRLPFRAPLHAEALLSFLGDRAIDGIDGLVGDSYQRNLRLPYGPGTAVLRPGDGHVAATLRLADLRVGPRRWPAAAACSIWTPTPRPWTPCRRRPLLAPVVFEEAGVRVPRATDGFEIAVRAVVGQQISVAAARTVLRSS